MKRAITNLVTNAARFGDQIVIRAATERGMAADRGRRRRPGHPEGGARERVPAVLPAGSRPQPTRATPASASPSPATSPRATAATSRSAKAPWAACAPSSTCRCECGPCRRSTRRTSSAGSISGRTPRAAGYRETFRDPAARTDGRAASTAIYFLLAAGQVSRWHRVDAAEVWHWYGGAALELSLAAERRWPAPACGSAPIWSQARRRRSSFRPAIGSRPGHSAPGRSAAARWRLAFTFAGFEMAPDGLRAGRHAAGSTPRPAIPPQ